ncbi:MAG: hypothetical protein WA902_20795 [Thermosynechococcaceae cyanobacterium]
MTKLIVSADYYLNNCYKYRTSCVRYNQKIVNEHHNFMEALDLKREIATLSDRLGKTQDYL